MLPVSACEDRGPMTASPNVAFSDDQAAYSAAQPAVVMCDEHGMVLAWTQTAERLVGYAARDVVGRSAAAVLLPSERASTVSELLARSRTRNGWAGTTAVRHRNGHMLSADLRISMLRGLNGPVRWLVSVTDIGMLSREAMHGSVRESLLTRAPIGIVVRDPQLRCTWVNDTVEDHDGIARGRRLGGRLGDVLPDAEAETVETMMRQVLKDGSIKVHRYQMRPPANPRREHTMEVSFLRLQGAEGQALGVCSISVDVTESRQACERLAVLSQASARLGGSLDVMQTSQELTDLAVPLLADCAAVDLEQAVPFTEGTPRRAGRMGERPFAFRRAGLTSIHQGVPESPWARGEPVPAPPDSSPFMDALSTGRPHLEPVLESGPGTWVDDDPARARVIRDNGVHSVMIVPIRARRALLGVALFLRTDNPVPFQEFDLLLAEELVRRATLSLDDARHFACEHTEALALQRDLLPHGLSTGVAVEVAARYVPADTEHGVGGDWFDVIQLPGARVALVVGDVVGHGLHAAAAMGRLRTAVRTLADMELPPDELLDHLDDTVQRLAEEDARASDQTPAAVVGATCLYAVYDPVTRTCAMARAGHPPPAVIDLHGQVTFPDLPAGPPLGIGMGIPFEAVEFELPEGSLLALYTDGLIENRDHDIDEGMRRLGAALARPSRSLEDLCTRVMETVPGQAPSDDVTLLLVRTRSLGPAQVASWTLPADQTAVRSARHMAASQLSAWGLEGLEDSTKLIVSELVTNAVRHGTGPIGLRLIQHQALTCEVFDTGVGAPRMLRARSVDENGRGLFLVAQLSRRWGARPASDGKVVWAEEDLAAANSHASAADALHGLKEQPGPAPTPRSSDAWINQRE
ncbi:SpoIIE family protein phosphatase [Streptomyces sp. NPDC003393]